MAHSYWDEYYVKLPAHFKSGPLPEHWTDSFGKQVRVGDTVAYAVTGGWLRVGRVVELKFDGLRDRGGGYKYWDSRDLEVRVIGVKPDGSTFKRKTDRHSLIVISRNSIPRDALEALDAATPPDVLAKSIELSVERYQDGLIETDERLGANDLQNNR